VKVRVRFWEKTTFGPGPGPSKNRELLPTKKLREKWSKRQLKALSAKVEVKKDQKAGGGFGGGAFMGRGNKDKRKSGRKSCQVHPRVTPVSSDYTGRGTGYRKAGSKNKKRSRRGLYGGED